MGKFESTTAVRVDLPSDIPNAADAADDHPDGAVWVGDDGRRFRLQHARWTLIKPRSTRKSKDGKPSK